MISYDKKYCKIRYIDDIRCVHLDWIGFAKSTEFREACDYSLQLLKEKGANAMIADNSKGKGISTDDEEWMTKDWFPRAIAAGFRISAVIVGADMFRTMAVKSIVNELDQDTFSVQYFDEFFKAKSWIRQQQMSTK